MKKKSLVPLLLLGLNSFTVQAVDTSSVWLETANPDLKNKIKVELLMNYGDTAKNQPDYPMVGVGDGLGIYQQQDKTIILMNHELKEKQGKIRAHGEKGAFVSKWTLGKQGLIKGEDLIKQVAVYNHELKEYRLNITGLSKLCSADLPSASALFFQQQDKQYGTQARIFFSGEELSTKKYKRYGRAFAHVVDGDFAGTSFELPKLGRMAFENIVLSPYPQQQTIAMLMDDATNVSHDAPEDEKAIAAIHKKPPSELYIYIGNKQQQTENPIEAAGLNNGQLYGIQVEGMAKENRQQAISAQTPFKLIALDNEIEDEEGKKMQIESVRKGISQFLRIEDGAWNLQKDKQHEYFFTTTDQFKGNSRLYKLAFT
ncbi:MAG: hypothetical protein GQ569_11745, partial [Methylococcaceae bacterium]|nr:hypothetical protein [Methylococcaceae bacterium]